jgi:hypothetical protein
MHVCVFTAEKAVGFLTDVLHDGRDFVDIWCLKMLVK